MKIVKTKIGDATKKHDWLKIKMSDAEEMASAADLISNWIEELNDRTLSPVTEAVYSAIDNLVIHFEQSFRRL